MKNMKISVNIGPTIQIQILPFYCPEFVTFGVTQGGRVSSKEMSKCDAGEGTQEYRLLERNTF